MKNIEFLFESKVNGEHDVTIALEDAKFEGTIHNVYLSFYTLTILRKVTNQNRQVELPRNYVCYLELTGFSGANEVFIWWKK